MSATGQDSIHAGLPMLTGFTYAKFNDIASVKALITDDTAAIMLELVQGEGGVFPADPAFVAELVALAQTNGILLLVMKSRQAWAELAQDLLLNNMVSRQIFLPLLKD